MSNRNQDQPTTLLINRGVATITLNKPEKHNAFDDLVIDELLGHLETIKNQPGIRVMVLQAEGKHFCAGAKISQ